MQTKPILRTVFLVTLAVLLALPTFASPAPTTSPSRMEKWAGKAIFEQLRQLNTDVFLDAIGAMTDQARALTGSEVTVAVIDSGLDTSSYAPLNVKEGQHFYYMEEEDGERSLRAYIMGEKFNAYQDADTSDDVGHGTAVTSIITTIAPEATIVPVKVVETETVDGPVGSQVETVCSGIDWAVDKGVDIICCSLGFETTYADLEAAISRAEEAGIIVIAAAGNPGAPIAADKQSYPATLSTVVSVGMLDKGGNIGGRKEASIDVYAPGEGVYFYLPTPEPRLVNGTGTSFAVPQVVGAAALWKELYPNGTPANFRFALEKSSTKFESMLKEDRIYAGYGKLNIEKLLNYGPTAANITGSTIWDWARTSVSLFRDAAGRSLAQIVVDICSSIGRTVSLA